MSTMEFAEWVAVAAAWVTAFVAMGALWYASSQVREARRSREEQSRPYVVAYLDLNSPGTNIADLVIKNYGHTAAYEVRLATEIQLLRAAAPEGDPRSKVLVPKSFPILAPGQEWRTFFDSGSGDRAARGLPMCYGGVLTYTDELEGGKEYETPFVLDYKQFVDRLYVSKR